MYAIQLSLNEGFELERLNFGQMIDKAFWGLLVSIAMWAGSQLKDLTSSVQTLNQTMVGLSYKVEAAQTELLKAASVNEKQDDRLRNIELELSKIRKLK